MAEQDLANETLVTPEMIANKGVWGPIRTSPPISLSDIRKWAIATYWPETPPPIYWDEDYAKTTRHGSIIAPLDFNPFAWPIHRPKRQNLPRTEQTGANQQRRRTTGMNGGQVDEYGKPMRAGDIIRAKTRLKDWEEREGRLGLTLYAYSETLWLNQHDDMVRLRTSTAIRF